jgi:succinate dehydrogenase hydrophobic anchor subunit
LSAAASIRPVRTGLAIAVSGGLTGVFAGLVYTKLRGDRMAPWILGRATGVVAYLLLVALVVLGITLSHPHRAVRGRSAVTRMRTHVALSLLALAMMGLHVVILATDKYAGVGWSGALLPMQSSYRPVGVTLGVLGTWIGLLAGLSAGAAGYLPLRLWFPLHRIAALSFVLVLVHGLIAGRDTAALLIMYVATGLLVVVFAVSRYTARKPLVDA